jgi:hypothetical protein
MKAKQRSAVQSLYRLQNLNAKIDHLIPIVDECDVAEVAFVFNVGSKKATSCGCTLYCIAKPQLHLKDKQTGNSN